MIFLARAGLGGAWLDTTLIELSFRILVLSASDFMFASNNSEQLSGVGTDSSYFDCIKRVQLILLAPISTGAISTA